jgi:hypothetical protein
MENENEKRRSLIGAATLLNLTGVVGLVAFGWFIINRFKKLREGPILIGVESIEEAEREVTISIPPIFIPKSANETEQTVADRYKPSIRMEGLDMLVEFEQVQANVLGVSVSYTPDPIRIKLTRTIPSTDQLAIAAKLTPRVMPSIDPDGWFVEFPKITFLA